MWISIAMLVYWRLKHFYSQCLVEVLNFSLTRHLSIASSNSSAIHVKRQHFGGEPLHTIGSLGCDDADSIQSGSSVKPDQCLSSVSLGQSDQETTRTLKTPRTQPVPRNNETDCQCVTRDASGFQGTLGMLWE